MKAKTVKTVLLAVIAVSFAIAETAYFGWHWTPQTPNELYCGIISFLLVLWSLLNLKKVV